MNDGSEVNEESLDGASKGEFEGDRERGGGSRDGGLSALKLGLSEITVPVKEVVMSFDTEDVREETGD